MWRCFESEVSTHFLSGIVGALRFRGLNHVFFCFKLVVLKQTMFLSQRAFYLIYIENLILLITDVSLFSPRRNSDDTDYEVASIFMGSCLGSFTCLFSNSSFCSSKPKYQRELHVTNTCICYSLFVYMQC